MKKFAYVTTNFTGKKFMCISLQENPKLIELWSDGFKIGGVYYELKLDIDGQNIAKQYSDLNGDDEIILLMDENENTIYADKEQFVEVEGMHRLLNNMWIGLN